mmetsp:Transcript_15766/g.37052  ORF Transcript_15766/g.37052 Transcript_15766/m.37052 type:complete len:307 (+) Transcript_15766:148-1068(+)
MLGSAKVASVSILLLSCATVVVRSSAEAGEESPFAHIAKQLVAEECPNMLPEVTRAWEALQAYFFEAQANFFSPEQERRWLALQAAGDGLQYLFDNALVADGCPTACARHFFRASEWSIAMGHPTRGRFMLQLGSLFKMQATSRFYTHLQEIKEQQGLQALPRMIYEPRMQMEYQIAAVQLHTTMKQPLQPVKLSTQDPKVEIHSICVYKPDETSSTVPDSPLPDLSVPNHRAYAERHGHRYVLHTTIPEGEEAQYSKIRVAREALERPEDSTGHSKHIRCLRLALRNQDDKEQRVAFVFLWLRRT